MGRSIPRAGECRRIPRRARCCRVGQAAEVRRPAATPATQRTVRPAHSSSNPRPAATSARRAASSSSRRRSSAAFTCPPASRRRAAAMASSNARSSSSWLTTAARARSAGRRHRGGTRPPRTGAGRSCWCAPSTSSSPHAPVSSASRRARIMSARPTPPCLASGATYRSLSSHSRRGSAGGGREHGIELHEAHRATVSLGEEDHGLSSLQPLRDEGARERAVGRLLVELPVRIEERRHGVRIAGRRQPDRVSHAVLLAPAARAPARGA